MSDYLENIQRGQELRSSSHLKRCFIP